jgi:hypothetical protein
MFLCEWKVKGEIASVLSWITVRKGGSPPELLDALFQEEAVTGKLIIVFPPFSRWLILHHPSTYQSCEN